MAIYVTITKHNDRGFGTLRYVRHQTLPIFPQNKDINSKASYLHIVKSQVMTYMIVKLKAKSELRYFALRQLSVTRPRAD